MNTFEVTEQGPDAFVARIKSDLAGRKLGEFVAIERRGDEIVLVFTRLGTSEMHFSVQHAGAGFRATQSSEKIALAHRAFRGEFERRLKKILEKAGARVS